MYNFLERSEDIPHSIFSSTNTSSHILGAKPNASENSVGWIAACHLIDGAAENPEAEDVKVLDCLLLDIVA